MYLLDLVYPETEELLEIEKGELATSVYGLPVYFRVRGADDADAFHDGAAHAIQISIRYLDIGTDPIVLAYSTDASTETTQTIVTKGNTGKWKWKHKTISSNARFDHSVYLNFDYADFALTCDSELLLSNVTLRETALNTEAVWKAAEERVTATAGEAAIDTTLFSGWTVSATYLARDTGSDSTSAGLAPDDYPFYAGATYANRASAPFRVTPAGALVATSATITGAITATSGTIGGFSVGSDYVRDAANSFGLASTVTGGDDVRFWAGAAFASRASAPFRVTEAGAVVASSGQIGGWKILSNRIKATNDDIVLNSAIPKITLSADADSVGYMTGAGVFIGLDSGAYKMRIGDPASAYLAWTGTKLIKRGARHIGTSEVGDSDVGASDSDLMIVYGHIQSDDWVSGATGSGWRISNAGKATFNNITARGALRSSVFETDSVSAVSGTLVVAKSAGVLDVNMTVPNTGTWTMSIEDPPGLSWLFANNDIIRIKQTEGSTSETWYTVTRVSQSGGHQTYTCTYQSGNRNVTYAKGLGVLDYGKSSGHGLLEMSAEATGAPYYSVRTHTGSPWTTVTEHGRIGNLNGAFGIGSDVFGFGFGNYAAGNYIVYDSTNGLRLSGQTSGAHLAFGNPPPTNATAGTGIYIDYTGIYGLASNVQQAYLRASDGKIVAGAGSVTLDADGITILDPGTKNDENTIKWVNSGTNIAEIVSYLSGTTVTSQLNFIGGSNTSSATIHSRGGTAKNGTLTLATDSNTGYFGTYASVLTLTSTTTKAYARFYNTQTTDYGVLISNANPSITTPSSLLHLYSTAPTFRMEDSTTSAKSLLVTTDANLTKFEEAGGAANNLLVLDLANARVGIGTASAGYPLQISGATDTMLSLHRATSGGYAQMSFARSSDAGLRGGVTYDNTNDYMYLGNSTAAVLYWNQSGEVAIGTSAGSAWFNVNASHTDYTTSFMRLSNSSATGQTPLDFYINGTLRGKIRVDYVGNMNYVANGSGHTFYVGGDSGTGTVSATLGNGLQMGNPTGGDKGTGTINVATDIYKNNTAYTNPDYALEQWATGKIEKYADRARARDYRRMSLAELEQHIRKHYRLPRITDEPSGIFDMADIALEKIEELFTHVIELNHRLEKLEARS